MMQGRSCYEQEFNKYSELIESLYLFRKACHETNACDCDDEYPLVFPY